MAAKSPRQIQAWLDAHMYKLDLGIQMLGTEPNAVRRPWEPASARWCMVASWPYEAAAGNQSIPAVYKSIHDADDTFLCDRFYLPATPGDMRLMEKNNIPVFGIESKHPLTDFDVVATSISYPVLSMSFLKMLTMSGIPARWKDRCGPRGLGVDEAAQYPMVIVGGLSYGAPEVLSPVVDCWFLGEAEDEPGNPGIGEVTRRIAEFKRLGRWSTDRVGCYADLAREFNFLYFPRFVDVKYGYEDRAHVGVGPHLSKQVTGYVSLLDGMRMPFRKRHVRNLDAIAPLDNPPLLYADPAMGSGDLEVARGSVAGDSYILVQGEGLRRFDHWGEDDLHPHGADLGVLRCDAAGKIADVSHVLMNGIRPVVRVATVGGHDIVCTPDHEISVIRGPAVGGRPSHSTYVPPEMRGPRAFEFKPGKRLDALADRPLEWVRADELVPEADYVPVYYGQNIWSDVEQRLDIDIHLEGFGPNQVEWTLPSVLNEDVAWFLGMLAGDISIKSNGDTAVTTSVYLRMRTEDEGVSRKAARILARLFGREVTPKPRDPGKPECLTYEVRSAVIMRWLARNFGITNKDNRRRVPTLILKSPRAIVASYLSGFYDSDGTYDTRQGRPSWCSQSVELIRVVSLLMLNLGAPCAVQVLTGVARKKDDAGPADRVLAKVQGLQATDGDWSWLNPSHTRRLPHIETWKSSGASRNGKTAARGVIYTPVRRVTPEGEAKTYDISVPDYEAFTANGIYVHNCPAWCSFCALTYRQKPYRQRSVGYVVDYAKKLQDNLGSTRMAPFSPDLPMHTQRRKLIAGLLEKVSDEVDAASMRVDDFTADNTFILLQVHGGMDSVTLGVEGNSQRMRDLVGKGTSDADVKEAVTRGIRAGIRKFKLFMISNLPGEDEGDVYRILKLAKDLADIRESMGQPTVRIQFSWTPLMIEANTPFQWFAPQPANRILGDVWEELRDLKIDFKIGSKSEPNKAHFFQLCQRASREVGEALVDAMLEVDQACWGGVPRNFQQLIEDALISRGFDNGYGDCFDERFKQDMFGWEFIDQGISNELLWQTYVQMREFVEQTDSHSYDLNFDATYHGSEWVARCDERCQGKTCGACNHADLKERNNYIRAVDRDIDLSTIQSVDQHSQAVRIRARLTKPESLRFVGNDHWRFLFRRACFRAQTRLGMEHGIAKRSIRFASDEVKYRDWTAGTDYVEFAFTRPISDNSINAFVYMVDQALEGRMSLGEWTRHPVDAVTIRSDVDLTLFDVEVDADYDLVSQRLSWWRDQADIPMRLKIEGGYFAPGSETVNAKDFVDDLWAKQDGHRLHVRMLVHGRPNPYNIVAALMGKASWLPYAAHAAHRVDVFIATDRHQQDFLRPVCRTCGLGIPVTLLDQPYHPDYCPRCLDEHE